ncbi:hypothetical protein KR200_010791, partial [Drosophila serrata]
KIAKARRHLIVALIDRSDENGKMTEMRWRTVHARLVESLVTRLEEDPFGPMPTFDGAGWLNGVEILKCMDDPTRKWLTQTVGQLRALWKRAKLEVVDRELIPFIPKAFFPIAIQGDRALKLLQSQNPDIPTADWKVLYITRPLDPGNKDDHTLKAGEVEKDLGLETIVDAAQELTLDKSEEEEDGDLRIIGTP